MPAPQSNQFSICDWNQRAASTTSPTDRTILDNADGYFQYATYKDPEVVGADGAVVLVADATKINGQKDLVVKTTLPLTFPSDSFTFEFDISFDDSMLPANFSEPANRIFVAAVDKDGYVAGILFSKQGLALASYAEDPYPTLLAGATDVMYGDDGKLAGPLTVRVNVDASTSRTALYVSRTLDAYNLKTGGTVWADNADLSLRNNVQSRLSDERYESGIILQASSQTLEKVLLKNPAGVAQTTAFAIYSLRVHNGLAIPAERPVAVLSAASQVVVGSSATLDGRSSFSKTLGQLTHSWEIESAPDGSRTLLEGSARATAQIANDLVVVHRKPTALANEYSVVLQAAAAQADGIKFTFSNGVLTIRLAVAPGIGGNFAVVSTANDVIDAFTNPANPAFDPTLLSTFEILLGPTNGSSPLATGTYLFSGGKGSDLPTTRIVPDVSGLYVISLVVYDGARPSLKVKHSLFAAVTEQLFGHRPNTQYLFRHISDFWNLVPDKAQVETIWSAITQVISAEVLAAWQHDYGKSIKDIGRLYQRRWRNYSTYQERTDHYDLVSGHFSTPLVGAFQKNTTTDVTVCRVINVVTVNATAPVAAGNKVLLKNSLTSPVVLTVESISKVKVNQDNTVEWSITFKEMAPYHENLGGSRAGRIIPDATNPNPQATSTWFTSEGYVLNGAVPGDVIRIKEGKKYLLYTVVAVNPIVNNQKYPNTVVLDSARTIGGLPIEWEHLRPATGTFLESVPYFRYVNTADLTEEPYGLADYLDLSMTVTTSGLTVGVPVPIEAHDKTAVMVGWTPLINLVNQLSPGGPDPLNNPRDWDTRDLPALSIQLLRFRHAHVLPGDKDLASVPTLGDTLAAKLYENTDYRVDEDGDIRVKHWCFGMVSTVAQSNIITFVSNLSTVFHVNYSHDLTYEELVELGAVTLVLEKGDAAAYTIVGKGPQSNQYIVDRVVRTTVSCLAHIPRFHHNSTSLLNYWGEVSFFNNNRMIEGNFGLYVGLPKELLDQNAGNVDYLSVVRSMWFAFMNGPTLSNLRLPLQSLLGLPVTDTSGQIIRLDEATPEEPGVVVVVDAGGFQHTYPVPPDVMLAVSPSTGRPFKEFPNITLNGYPTDMVEATVWFLENGVVRSAEQLLLFAQHLAASQVSTDMQALASWLSLNYLTVPTRRDLYEGWVQAIPASLLASDYLDSLVPAYTSLTQPVFVDDYISNPSLVDGVLSGQESLRKFHTFVAEIPLKLTRSTSVFTLMDKFLDEARAAHTDYVLFGKLDLHDDIVVTDDVQKVPTLHLIDSPSSSPFMAKNNALKPNGAPYVSLAVENQLWPIAGATQAFQAPFQNAQPLSTNNRVGDVKERYESGYVEGMLDNYSGDGSLNPQVTPAWVDPVNQNDLSDIDVCRSKMWIPIEKLADGKDFQIGEKLELVDPGLAAISTVWSISPPVVEHVGSGTNPKLPGVTFLQETTKFSYLWLGFEYVPDQLYDCLGTEARLDALKDAVTIAQGLANVRIRGLTSQATAKPLETVDRANPIYKNYFYLDRIHRNDKAGDYGPSDIVNVTVVKYIPFGGITLNAFRDNNTSTASFNDLNYYREVQTRPYRPAVQASQQFVPSVGPGCYTQWGAANPAVDKVNWGYGFPNVNQQDVNANPLAITAFTRTNNPDLENLHFGMTLASKKGLQFSQGFTSFNFPSPSIKRVTKDNNTQLRIEGNFFLAPEVGAVVTPTTFTGTLGGSWVFVRLTGDNNTANWTAATAVTFETGTANNTTVLGVPNASQTSTGHVLVATIPANLTNGSYDVVVRHYRPYPVAQLHLETDILVNKMTSQGGVLTVNYFEQPF